MAWAIIGGLISSTLLARLVTPVMYKLIPPEIHPEKRTERVGVPANASV
jgi:Cu/Ag efflux pump CusA